MLSLGGRAEKTENEDLCAKKTETAGIDITPLLDVVFSLGYEEK
jgi:biopolymer transport protein ExbD